MTTLASSMERTEHLKQVMGFNEEDLAENRLGRLSMRQQDNLKQTVGQYRQTSARYVVPGLIAGVLVLVMMVVGIGASLSNMRLSEALQIAPFLAIPFLVIGGALGYQVWRYRRLNRQAETGSAPVKRYQGKVRLVVVNYGMSMAGVAASAMGQEPRQYQLRIGGRTFYPPGPVFGAFQNGQKYTVYAAQTAYA